MKKPPMLNPLVSVIIPVYNGEAFIREAVESVLRQDYEPLEVIVVDDGSTDRSAGIAASMLAAPGPSFVIMHETNQGAAAALNNGVKAGRGKYVCWLSADDRFLQGKLRAQVRAMEADASAWLTYTDFEHIGASGAVTGVFRVTPYAEARMMVPIMLANNVNGSSVMLRREVFERVGYFDEALTVDVDGDYWLRLLAAGGVMRHVPGRYLQYRLHDDQLSKKAALMQETKDFVRARAIATAGAERLFPGVPPERLPEMYRQLARALRRLGLDRAGEAALARAAPPVVA